MITPTRGKILAEVLSNERMTPFGLYLAETIKEVPHRGRVIAIGSPGIDRKGREVKICVNPGDTVYFKRQWLSFWENDRKKYVFLKNDDVIGKE